MLLFIGPGPPMEDALPALECPAFGIGALSRGYAGCPKYWFSDILL